MLPIQYLAIVGAVINSIGTIFYTREVLRGKVKPNKMSFIMWSAAPLIGGAAALFRGATWATIPVFAAGILPLMALVAAIRTPGAYWKLTKSDYACGAFSALALILWLITNEPNVAIVFAILSDGFASTPTLVKSWHHPETELGWTYLASSFSGFTGILAAPNFAFAQVAFPTYLFVMMGLIGIAAMWPRLKPQWAKR